MKTIEEELGKVSLTCNGQWNDRPYERLCIVHDGFYASYISRKAVPAGIPLSNEEYWQPIACLLYTSPSPRDLSTSRMPSSA